jgi:hypothetical protein
VGDLRAGELGGNHGGVGGRGGNSFFVRLYEEPTLQKMFGADYQEYCKNVPRWIPRMRAWQQ